MNAGKSEARVDVMTLSTPELEALAVELGEPAYRGRQLFEWLYRHGAPTFEEMHTLPRRFRDRLDSAAIIGRIRHKQSLRSSDQTQKWLFELPSGLSVETVLIPDFDETGAPRRMTVCVSSQVGCAMGCTFCATGRMGFRQDLSASEIADQVFWMNRVAEAEFGRPVTNVVYMGMGEPLLNYDAVLESVRLITDPRVLGLSPRRITVSTVGIASRIRSLADDDPGVSLAVSLHAPDDRKRSSIMPVNRRAKTDLAALRASIEYYHRVTGRRITYEYCMFAGFNDSIEDAGRLADVARWVPSKVNLIMYNAVEGTGFRQTSEDRLNEFIATLVERGVTTTVRRSRGQDISAACGQLASHDEPASIGNG